LFVSFGSSPESRREFARAFRIGRADDCDISIKDEYVSRNHAEVVFASGQWWVRDLQSVNGIYVGDRRVTREPITPLMTIRLGIQGPLVWFEVEQPPPPRETEAMNDPAVARFLEHYLGADTGDRPPGEHTILVRKAFAHVQTKQKRKYGQVIALLILCVAAAGAYALYLRREAGKQKALAEGLFYSMKSLDLDIANVERLVADSHTQPGIDQIRKDQGQRNQMEQNYDRFLATLNVYDRKMTEQQRVVLRIARIFGECELAMPPQFATEIDHYIQKWKSSGRLAKAITAAQANGYTSTIAQEMLAQGLPPQFFYLALQESNFDPYISGSMTRKGIAKGMWQFIPETAMKYGLKIGPLADLRRPDPGDDRHHWDRETKAAARYLKDLYSTDAQASGFLVMACYNWGEDYVLPLVRSMPANPKERNFWKLLTAYRDKLPRETYDYVFYIASAAVIGENPRQFGFDFDNPLANLESR